MSRVKLTAKNTCHTPVLGGGAVETLIASAARGELDHYIQQRGDINVASMNGITALHALARKGSGSKADRLAFNALVEYPAHRILPGVHS